MKIFDKVRDIARAVLYTVTFRLLFLLLRSFFRLFINVLYIGFFYLFFYVLFGAAIFLFLGFKPVFWDMKTQLFAAGFVFWTVVSIVTAIKNIQKKMYEINLRQEEEKMRKYRQRQEREFYREMSLCEKAEKKALRAEKKEARKERLNSYFYDENGDF
ncbi:MAG: hypothetical protein LBT30_01550 [Clostridiales bacterium]|jgi:ABC-type multidrug transport system fused ATPase/permease subunit|nr:hypothetical protein [Clostridiales bacterium]